MYELGTEIDLSYNRLTELPKATVKSPALRKLTVYHNNIAVIPDNIDKVYTLVYLDLSYNKLEVCSVYCIMLCIVLCIIRSIYKHNAELQEDCKNFSVVI